MRRHRYARPVAQLTAWLAVALSPWTPGAAPAGAASKTADGPALARRALQGDGSAAGELETAVEPLFDRKDLQALDEPSGAREAAKLLGLPEKSVRWLVAPGGAALRLLTVDLGAAAGGGAGASDSPGAGANGYVAYAIVEPSAGGAPHVSWYHDAGRKVAEQGGRPWHPVGLTAIGGSEGSRALAVAEAFEAGSGDARGVLVLEQKGGDWTATRRLTGGADARLIGVGPQGAVFVAGREAPKGVLTGAPASLFRTLVWFERMPSGFTAEPAAAPVADVVTATEAVMAALRRGDKDEARRLCATSEVVDQMLYFSPGWKGGGRVVQATPTTLEVAYEEIQRPPLRLVFTYQNRGGGLVLTSVTGRGEKDAPKG